MRFFLIFIFGILLTSCAGIEQPSEQLFLKNPDNNVYAFVGRKVSARKDIPTETVLETVLENGVERKVERRVMLGMDERMVATYEVVHPITQSLVSETITFTAYDHFGFFNFADYEYALILVGKERDEYFLHKYQHDSVFKTKDGRWAACGESPIDTTIYDIPELKAVDIDFSPEVKFGPADPPPISRGFINETKALEDYWNSPIFQIEGESAVCKKGLYVEDLFELRINTVMKARGQQN